MIRRGLALGLVFGLASVAQAGVVVELEAKSADRFQPCGQFGASEAVLVEVYLRRDATVAEDKLIRLVQLDFSLTSAGLSLPALVSWASPVALGFHHIEDEIAGIRPNLVAIAHSGPRSDQGEPAPTGPADLQGDPGEQLVLPGDSSQRVKVGEVVVTMPAVSTTDTDVYTLDVLNAVGADLNNGAMVSFGFGIDVGDDITNWRAGTADLTGGSLAIAVSNPPVNFTMPSDSDRPDPVPSDPAVERRHLSRTKGGIIEILMTFNSVDPGAGQISIKELMPGGAFGPELANPADFMITVEDDVLFAPKRLVIKDISAAGIFQNETWYRISNASWLSASDFGVT